MMQLMRDKAHAVGKRLIVNGSGQPFRWTAGTLLAGDGFSSEMAMNNTWTLDYPTQTQVVQELAVYRAILNMGKLLYIRPHALDQYAHLAASVMLIREPGDAVFISSSLWPFEMPTAGWPTWPQQFGPALGPYAIVGDNVFERQFQNGSVTINFYTRQVTVTGNVSPP
jgi:hypothetical protein